jgi:murein tripeptide amidase MpaA
LGTNIPILHITDHGNKIVSKSTIPQ